MEEAIAVSDSATNRVVCCSVKTYFISNVVWGLICLGLLSVSTYGAVSPAGVFLVFPQEAYLILIGVSVFGLLLCFMGIWGSRRNNECCVLCFICLVALGLIAQVLLFAFVLLYINDVPTFNGLDQSAQSAQQALEDFLVDYSQREADNWAQAQNELGCCGVSYVAGCDGTINLALLESGSICLEGTNQADLAVFRATCPDPNPIGLDASPFAESQNYFCIDSIGGFLRENTPIIASVLGVILLAQIASLVAALRLYWVPKEKGGFSEPFSDKYGVAKPKTAEELGGGFTGQARAFTNRLSYRLNRATYQEGTQGGSIAGNIKNRLSYRGPPGGLGQGQNKFVSQMGPEPTGGAGAGPPRGPPPSMFNRLSKRLGGFGGFGGFGGGPPGPPPPGQGPPGPGMNQQTGGPGPMGSPPRQANAFRRVSARLQQGINQFRLPFGGGGRGPPAPPQNFSGPPPRGGPGFGGGPPGGGMGGPPRGGMGGPPRGGGMGGPPRGGMGGPPRGGMMGGPPRGGMGGPPRGGMMGGPPRGGMMGGPPRGGMMGGPPPPRGGMMGGPPRGGMGGPPRGGMMGGPPRGGMGGPPRGGGGMGMPPPRSRAPPPTRGGRGTRGGGRRGRNGPPPPRPSGGGGGGGRGGLLAQIQGGAMLKPTQTNDRSGPMV